MTSQTDPIIAAYAGPMYAEWASNPLCLLAHEKKLFEVFCPDKGKSILNIGCGAGRETIALHEAGYTRTVGLDCTPALVEAARRRSGERGLDIEYLLCPAHQIPLEDSRFDVVTMFANVYGHITPRSLRISTLQEIHRVMRPGGCCLSRPIPYVIA